MFIHLGAIESLEQITHDSMWWFPLEMLTETELYIDPSLYDSLMFAREMSTATE